MRNAGVARTSKSPKAVARAALLAAQRVLPFYTHPNSPKVFTQHQLFACLVLKNFWKTDYRGVVAQLADHPQLCEVLRLTRVPHFTTLQKASRHLLASQSVRRVLESTIRLHYGRRRRVASSAVASTEACSTPGIAPTGCRPSWKVTNRGAMRFAGWSDVSRTIVRSRSVRRSRRGR